MNKATLSELNETFGTAARAHDFDPRFLIGATVDDLRLAFVPGVKGVLLPTGFKATEKQGYAFLQSVGDTLGVQPTHLHEFRKYLPRSNHPDGREGWHFDCVSVGDALEDTTSNDRIRVLTHVAGRSTRVALSAPLSDRLAEIMARQGNILLSSGHVSFSVPKQLFAERLFQEAHIPKGGCVAFGVSHRIPNTLSPVEAFARASEHCLMHATPVASHKSNTETRLTLANDYGRAETPRFCYAPSR